MDRLIISLAIIGLIILSFGSPGNLEHVKLKAESHWKSVGFEVVGYEGYQWGFGGFGTPYGGAKVWYALKATNDNGIKYTGYLQRWGDEIHNYGPKAIDAIKPQ